MSHIKTNLYDFETENGEGNIVTCIGCVFRSDFQKSQFWQCIATCDPIQQQIMEQGIPACRQQQASVQPALQLHDTICRSLSGAEGKSVGIVRRKPLARTH